MKLNINLRNIFKRPKYSPKGLSQQTRYNIAGLHIARIGRLSSGAAHVSIGIIAGTGGGIFHNMARNPSIAAGAAILFGASAAGAAVGYIIAVKAHSKGIREATGLIKEGLKEEVKTDSKFKDFVRHYKYFTIDNDGYIRATNRPRIFGIGRLRIERSELITSEFLRKERMVFDYKLLNDSGPFYNGNSRQNIVKGFKTEKNANPKFGEFLNEISGHYEYVTFNRKGDVEATNARFGVPRIKISEIIA